ncbi:MAG: hypothetical protein CMB82_09960 [Flammeovirgaceae bacterium]|nr:hypothetical protein [Flammeovirgaceae bacterium]
MKKSKLFVQGGMVLAIIVVVNLLSEVAYFRVDFTEDNRYTLGKATRNVLENLDEVITVKAYFTEELPAQLGYIKDELRDQFVEYENRSNGNFVFEFINPNTSDELKQEAIQNGVRPVSINVVEDDQRQQIQAFMGVVIQADDKKEVIPLVQPGSGLEYEITTSIKKIILEKKPKIGMIQSKNGVSLGAIPQLLQQLSVMYEIVPFNLSDSSVITPNYSCLIWISPNDTVPSADFVKLNQYLDMGGNLFLAYSNISGDLQTAGISTKPDIGLKSWLQLKGISLGDEVVIDAACASVTVQQRQGFFTMNSQIEFPYFPQIREFEKHPITVGLESVMLPFSSPLRIIRADTSLVINAILRTSEMSGTQNTPGYMDVQKKWSEQDFSAPDQILALSTENIGSNNGRMVVVSNGQFINNGEGQEAQQLSVDNINFAANAIDWLSDDTGLISLRTKGITSRPIEAIDDSTKSLIKYGNVFAPILLILIYGFIRRSSVRHKRQKWTQGDYS